MVKEQVTNTATELRKVLENCAAFLRSHDENAWSESMQKLVDKPRLTPRDADKVLGWFGGMGSLSDLVLTRVNGHHVDDETQANRILRTHMARICEAARNHLDAAASPRSETS